MKDPSLTMKYQCIDIRTRYESDTKKSLSPKDQEFDSNHHDRTLPLRILARNILITSYMKDPSLTMKCECILIRTIYV